MKPYNKNSKAGKKDLLNKGMNVVDSIKPSPFPSILLKNVPEVPLPRLSLGSLYDQLTPHCSPKVNKRPTTDDSNTNLPIPFKQNPRIIIHKPKLIEQQQKAMSGVDSNPNPFVVSRAFLVKKICRTIIELFFDKKINLPTNLNAKTSNTIGNNKFSLLPPTVMSQSFPLPETPHRISIYKKEPRRLGQPIVTPTKTATTKLPQPMISVNGSIDKIQTRIASIDTRTPKRLIQQTHPRSPRIVRHQPKAKKLCLDKIFFNSLKIIYRVEIASITSEFVPWPTIEEVKAQRSELFATKIGAEDRARRSPPKAVKMVHSVCFEVSQG